MFTLMQEGRAFTLMHGELRKMKCCGAWWVNLLVKETAVYECAAAADPDPDG
jgi:hypothetical protein